MMSSPTSRSSSLQNAMTTHLTKRRASSSFRSLTTTPANSIDFSSNDFLSLSTSSLLKTAFSQELQNNPSLPIGSGGSRLLDGNSRYAEALECDIAAFHNAPAGLLFNSGFDANAGFFATVPQVGDVVVYDEFIHASVHEGMRLSRAKNTLSFKHNSVSSLKARLDELRSSDVDLREGRRDVFIAVEGLYSMDGDLAPLVEIVEVVESSLPLGNGHVIVDEAHSTGVYGEKGRGLVCSLGLEKRVFAKLHTFGKAIGCHGAIILCDSLTRSYLINYARALIYTTAMSFPSLAAVRASYSLFMSGKTETIEKYLQDLIYHLYSQLESLSLRTQSLSPQHKGLIRIPNERPKSPIFSIQCSEPRSLAKWCQEGGFVVRAIVAPTVPQGTERVRVCLHAANSFDDVERLVRRIGEWIDTKGKRKAQKSNL